MKILQFTSLALISMSLVISALLIASVATAHRPSDPSTRPAKTGAPVPAAPAVPAVPQVPDGLFIPVMDAEEGRKLFARKGCVVCHSVNNIGGHHTPFDASTMEMPMNAFEFAAKMWRGAEAMTMLMRQELDYVIELTGQELANIIAFAHDEEEQKKFSRDDIPSEIQKLIEHIEEHEHTGDHDRPHGH